MEQNGIRRKEGMTWYLFFGLFPPIFFSKFFFNNLGFWVSLIMIGVYLCNLAALYNELYYSRI